MFCEAVGGGELGVCALRFAGHETALSTRPALCSFSLPHKLSDKSREPLLIIMVTLVPFFSVPIFISASTSSLAYFFLCLRIS